MQQDSETRSEGPAVGSDAGREANADAAPPVVVGQHAGAVHASFRDRFALRAWDVVVIVVVA
nr:hypothetical protein [Acidobacteriota bacterium]